MLRRLFEARIGRAQQLVLLGRPIAPPDGRALVGVALAAFGLKHLRHARPTGRAELAHRTPEQLVLLGRPTGSLQPIMVRIGSGGIRRAGRVAETRHRLPMMEALDCKLTRHDAPVVHTRVLRR
eukprot:scaffold58854_cov26-Tisochrysis_lutea.AAC.2